MNRLRFGVLAGLLVALLAGLLPASAFCATRTWAGGTSTEWNLAGNWGENAIPTSADDVTIPANVASGRYPVVSTATGNAKTVTLATGAGTAPTLTVSADSLIVATTFAVNAGTVTLSGGRLKTTAGAVTVAGTVNISSGVWLSGGTITVSSGGNLNVSSTGILHMATGLATTPSDNLAISAGGNITLSGTTSSIDVRDFTSTAGSPSGALTQTGATFKLYHDFKASGTYTASAGTFQVAGAGTASNFPNTLGSTTFYNVVCDADPGISNDPSFTVLGNWTANTAVTMSGTAAEVVFSGTGTQTISGSTTTFAKLTINKASSSMSYSTVPNASNTLTVAAGTHSFTSGTPTVGAIAVTGGTLTVGPTTLTVGTISVSSGATLTHSSGTLGATGAVSITGTMNETSTFLGSNTFTINNGGNVNVSGSGIIHMASAIGTNPTDNLTIAAGGTLTQSGGSVDVLDFTSNSGSPSGIYNQSSGTLKIQHDFKGSGTFNGTGGTVQFAGNPSASTFPTTLGSTTFYNVQCDVDPDFDVNAVNFNVAGSWTASAAVDMSGKAVTVTFNGSSAQTIGGAAQTTFRNLTVNSSSTVTLTASQVVKSGDLTVSAGTLDLSSFTLGRSAAGGTITVSNGATLKLGGTNTFPANYTTHTLGATSTVNYNGTNQPVTAETYGHLTLSGSGTKTMPNSTTTVAGNFTMSGTPSATALAAVNTTGNFSVGNGCTFTTGAFTHDIKGNFTNDGTFTATGSTITLTSTSADQSLGGTTATTFANLTIAKSSTKVTLSTSESVSGTLTFTSGNISTGSNTLTMTSSGSVSRTSGHVIGNFKKNVATGSNVSRTYEIGDATGYTPLTAVFASVSVAGDLTCSTTSGDHANIATSDINTNRSVNRYWTMTNSGITFTTHSTTFTFLAGDVDAGAVTGSFVIRRWSGSAWSNCTAGSLTATTSQITGQSTVGDFQVGNVLSVSVSNSTFAFGTQVLNTWLTAQSSTITNDSPATENIVAQISTLTTGSNNWTLSSTANGADQVRAQYSTTSSSGPWTDVTAYASNFTVTTSLTASGTVTLYFRIQTPTSTTSISQYSSTLTVTAQ